MGGLGHAQGAGRHADSCTRYETTPHPLQQHHPRGADRGDAGRARCAGARQVVQRRGQEPLGVLVHLLGDQPLGGRPPPARRLRHRVQARARHHARASGALDRPCLRSLRRDDHAGRDQGRPQGPPLLHGHPDGGAPRLHVPGQGRQLPADGDGRFRQGGGGDHPLAQGAILLLVDWSLLGTLLPSSWQPNPGWKTGAPSYLPYVVASRQLQLRYNHSTDGDGHEVTPAEPIDRAEIAYMFSRAYKVAGEWMLYGLADYKSVTFPALSDRQKQVVELRAQVHRLSVHLGRRVPDQGLALRLPEGRRVRLLGLRLLHHEDALRLRRSR